VDLDQYLGTRNSTSGVLAQDKDLINHIKAILGPFVLRRVKSDVMKQLVAKTHEVVSVDMLEDQAAAYKEAVTQYRALAMAARSSKASKATSTNILDCLARRQVSNIFTQLRKLGNHPLLIRRIFTDETVRKLARKYHKMAVFGNECTVERVQEELNSYSDFTLHRLCLSYGGVPGGQGKLDDSYALASAKCQALVGLLQQLKMQEHRPLIFSQWTNMLDILEWALAVSGFRFTRLDGSTPVTERQNLVDEYNSNPEIFVFLLSTRAGGQGLNLTGADTVIIHDVDFNPQMDRQAEDRCHRIGQTKPVTVYRLVTNGTVDESIFRIAKQKLVLDAAVLESGGEKDSAAVQKERDVQTMGEILSTLLAATTS
jgi:SWI/SNF-related matrix-associated actin-dependent regulator 1 of chromatin subfamily A